MNEVTVGVRELKARLSHYLRLAKAGQTVQITDRGRPIGRIVPVVLPLEERMEAAVRSGLLSWNRCPLPPRRPTAKLKRKKKTLAELVIEGRK